jgi:hypothetical protein
LNFYIYIDFCIFKVTEHIYEKSQLLMILSLRTFGNRAKIS